VSKTLTILTAILAAQIVLFAVTSVDTHRVQKKEPFLSIDTSQVDYIKIRNEDGELTMKRIGANWKIVDPYDYPANPSYIKTLMEKMADLKLETFITGNPDKQELYELDDSTGKYVEFGKENGTVEKFYCGKASSSYTHTYIRRADSDEVWLVDGTPRSSFTRKPEQWRDKKILALDRSMIERVLLHHPGKTIELERQIVTPEPKENEGKAAGEPDTTWSVNAPGVKPFTPADKMVNRIMNTLKRLNALSFLDAGRDTIPDFSHPDFAIDVYLEGDQHEKLEFIPKPDEETRWLARKNEKNSTIFVVYQSSVNNLKKTVADLKGKEKKNNT